MAYTVVDELVKFVYLVRVKVRYSKEILEPLVKSSFSISEVIRKLGVLKLSGGTHFHVSKKIRQFGIDTSHFTGAGSNRGENHVGGSKKRLAADILIKRSNGYRCKVILLRRALIEIGRSYQCDGKGCEIRDKWLGSKLVLQVNHKNGDFQDDREINLNFLCPNCHSQTSNYGRKNRSMAER